MRTALLSILLLLFVSDTWSQEWHAWIYFKDKPQVQNSINNPSSILTARAVARKERFNINITYEDVPVNQAYVRDLKSQPGITYHTQSKWFNCAHVSGTYQALNSLIDLSYVERVVYADPSKSNSILQQNKFALDRIEVENTPATTDQLQMIGLDQLHAQGFTGSDVWIAVTDSGFPNVNVNPGFESMRLQGRLLGGFDFVAGNADYLEDHFHGARVLSIMAGELNQDTSTYRAAAPGASYYLFRTEDAQSETPVEMSYWVAAAERADSLGVDIVNVSLGYLNFDNPSENLTYQQMDGSSFISQGAAMASSKGMLVVVSAGNSGASDLHPWIAAPADAPGVFTVGAVTSQRTASHFSSVGPTMDGRRKPDVVALGSDTSLINENGTIQLGSGTSYSAPLISGGMACLMQAFPDTPPAVLIELVRQSGSSASTPDDKVGYGIPDFGKVIQTLSNTNSAVAGSFTYYIKDRQLFLKQQYRQTTDQLHLYDLLGQHILTENFKQQDQINLDHLSSGMYLFKIKSTGNSYKIIL